MTLILNLTQHAASYEQKFAGVKDLPDELREELVSALTFEEAPSIPEIYRRVVRILKVVDSAKRYFDEKYGGVHDYEAMVGGAPWLMGPLEDALEQAGTSCLYSFSKRVSTETTLVNGQVVKTNVFRHVGFVESTGGLGFIDGQELLEGLDSPEEA